MTERTLVDGVPCDTLSVLDRGLGYGDGLFETVRVVGDHAPLWSGHMARLAEGSRRLAMPVPAPDVLWREVLAVTAGMTEAVVRITVTRGIGPRGYAPPPAPAPARIVAAFPMPTADPRLVAEGLRLRVCDLRLAAQPALAGLKHLNRLEQVLARAEWNDPSIHEGLLLDAEDRVVCATMANVFVVIGGTVVTPSLARCGVAGVARAEVLAAWPEVQVRDLAREALRSAQEVFLTSSVRGILPVQAVGDKVFAPGPMARALQRHWRALGFPLELA
ncbi:MAG: aminodeoxychorismate lyase [Xanthomonadaceae bacterium]|nr:aminodeoxychorismate lyase [Xanthomonadaceae bacterium]MDE1963257.1 aminodeoxychorismate lyase [Xanthomonadaceae bacterium]